MKDLELRLDALNLSKEYYDYWVWYNSTNVNGPKKQP
jgi:hypothetical protein